MEDWVDGRVGRWMDGRMSSWMDDKQAHPLAPAGGGEATVPLPVHWGGGTTVLVDRISVRACHPGPVRENPPI